MLLPERLYFFFNLENFSLVSRRAETTLAVVVSEHIINRLTALSEYCIKSYGRTLQKYLEMNLCKLWLPELSGLPYEDLNSALIKSTLNSPKPFANKGSKI